MADRHDVRAYENERDRHRAAARALLAEVVEVGTRLIDRWDTQSPHLLASELGRLSRDAVTAHVRLAQYEALTEVEFLAVEEAVPRTVSVPGRSDTGEDG